MKNFIFIFNLPHSIKQKISNVVDIIALISLMLFVITSVILMNISTLKYHTIIATIYLIWGLAGLFINSDVKLVYRVIGIFPIFSWIFIIVQIFATYYYIKSNKYSTKEFFYNDKFEDY